MLAMPRLCMQCFSSSNSSCRRTGILASYFLRRNVVSASLHTKSETSTGLIASAEMEEYCQTVWQQLQMLSATLLYSFCKDVQNVITLAGLGLITNGRQYALLQSKTLRVRWKQHKLPCASCANWGGQDRRRKDLFSRASNEWNACGIMYKYVLESTRMVCKSLL